MKGLPSLVQIREGVRIHLNVCDFIMNGPYTKICSLRLGKPLLFPLLFQVVKSESDLRLDLLNLLVYWFFTVASGSCLKTVLAR